MDKITLLIADDHAVVRMGLRVLLESKPNLVVVGEADDGVAAVQKAVRLKPDVVILDLVMPVMDGAATTAEIVAKAPGTKVLILTTFCDSNGISRALKAGASGALLKNTPNSELVAAIRRIARGERVVSHEVEQLFLNETPPPDLSPRQIQVLAAVARGLTNAEIAISLDISPNSVKQYLRTVFEKIGAANRAEAASIAQSQHLLKI